MRDRFAGTPVKSVTLSFGDSCVKGDFVVTKNGVEGSAVYSLSAQLRDEIERRGTAKLVLDLAPDIDVSRLETALAAPRGKTSLSNHLRKKAGVDGVKSALLHEVADKATSDNPASLAHAIKHVSITLESPRPIAEAISVAGGIALDELDADFMLKKCEGIFAAGEMLDWEAPTGGYLLSACLATGQAAGDGAAKWLRRS